MKINLYVRYEKKLSGYWIMEQQGVLKGKKALLSLLFDLFINPDQNFWFFVEQQFHQEIEKVIL